MTFDSSRYRGDAAYPDEHDDGFRDSPAFRDSLAYRETFARPAGEPITVRQPAHPADGYPADRYPADAYPADGYPAEPYPAEPYPAAAYAPGTYSSGDYQQARPAADAVDEAYPVDRPVEPVRSRPARDRLAVHLGWELVLLAAAGAVGYLLWRSEPSTLRGASLDGLLVSVAALVLVSIGMAFSVRAAVPNLAVGPIAYAAGLFFADNSDRGVVVTAAVAGLLAVAAGITVAVVVTALHVPAWAASLAAAFALIAWIQEHRGAVQVVDDAYRPTEHAVFWLAGVVALSVLAALLGLVPSVRAAVGRFRPVADPAVRGDGPVVAAMALIVSSLLAAGAGVLLALSRRDVDPNETGVGLTGLALGAVLLGGTSVYGRRGGVLGTVLAVALLALLVRYADAEGWVVNTVGLAAAAVGLGLAVSRLVEALGRPRVRRARAEPAQPPPAAAEPVWSGEAAWTASRAPEEQQWDDRWTNR